MSNKRPRATLVFERFTAADYQILKMIIEKVNEQLPGEGIKLEKIQVGGVDVTDDFETKQNPNISTI